MNINKLTKKELRNLYNVYANGEFIKETTTGAIQVTGACYPMDKELLAVTIRKISKIMERKK